MNVTVRDNIKRNVAQKFPGVFTSDGGISVDIETQEKTLTVLGEGLADGEWVFSGGENTPKVSMGYINDIFQIKNNSVDLGFNAGDLLQQTVLAQKINIYFAANISNANKIMEDSVNYPYNKIILYMEGIERVKTEDDKTSLTEDLNVSARFTFGVVYHGDVDNKINGQEYIYDDFIQPCLYIRPEDVKTTSLVVFERMLESGYLGKKYYIIFLFSYLKNVYNEKEYLKSVRYYNTLFRETQS